MRNSDPKSYWSNLNKYSSEGRDKLQNVSEESFNEHFSKLNEATPENDFGDIDLDNLPLFDNELNAPNTVDEISKVTLKKSKSQFNERPCSDEYL